MIMRKKNVQYVLISLILTGILSGLTVCAAKKKGGGAPKMPQMPPQLVVVEPVQLVKKTAAKEYIGNVEAAEEVDIQPRISGYITGIKFKEGSLVKKGDLLFTIEDTTYKAKMLSEKAQLDQTAAELRYAQSNYHRKKLLADKKAISESTLEDAKRLVDYNMARYNQEKAELINAENEHSYTKIYAPITGRIGKVKYTRGNYVSLTSSPLAKIVSVDPILVKFSLSERSFQNIFKNVKAANDNIDITIKLSNGDIYKEKGKVALVDNVVDSDTGTISVWAKFKNPLMTLIPGGYVTALVSENIAKPLPGVKVSGVITDNKGSFVYVLGKNNIPMRRNVKLGSVVGNLYIIKSGLKPGEVIITDGTHKVIPGMPVKPVPAVTPGTTNFK
jgi:RND family efflux transporter MFP subunit